MKVALTLSEAYALQTFLGMTFENMEEDDRQKAELERKLDTGEVDVDDLTDEQIAWLDEKPEPEEQIVMWKLLKRFHERLNTVLAKQITTVVIPARNKELGYVPLEQLDKRGKDDETKP